MSATGLAVFDKTLQVTNTWLDEIIAELGPDRQVAWHVLSAVLHAVRDRLSPESPCIWGHNYPFSYGAPTTINGISHPSPTGTDPEHPRSSGRD